MLKLGLLTSLIVDPDSAILGYPDGKQMPMNADHRSICKFDTTTDLSYVILRSGLASTVPSLHRYYCVIDALNECTNLASLFASTLAELNGSSPLCILITS